MHAQRRVPLGFARAGRSRPQPTSSGAVPKTLLSTTRTRSPPMLVCTIWRKVWLLAVTRRRRARRCSAAPAEPAAARRCGCRRRRCASWRCRRRQRPRDERGGPGRHPLFVGARLPERRQRDGQGDERPPTALDEGLVRRARRSTLDSRLETLVDSQRSAIEAPARRRVNSRRAMSSKRPRAAGGREISCRGSSGTRRRSSACHRTAFRHL